jgi:ribosomal protein S18 acetylase RimI-like enzyme
MATAADAPSVQRCISAAFAPYREDYTPAAFADTVPSTAQVLQRIRSMHVMVASTANDATRVIGTLSALRVDLGHAHLRGMAVEPEFQGNGVAKALLSAMEAALHAQGLDRITLDVSAPLWRAQQLYERHSFRRTGRVNPFFGMLVYEYEKRLNFPMHSP